MINRRLEHYKSAKIICANLMKKKCGDALQKCIKYNQEDLGIAIINSEEVVEVSLVQKDVMTVIISDVGNDLNPLVVCQSGTQACGEWDIGTDGFEESLAYRSTLSLSFIDELYPVKMDECLYAPCVYAFRGDEYQTIKSFPFSVVSLTTMSRADFSVKNDRDHMISTLNSVFQVAIKHGHKSIIFNAFGCKDDNNPDDIARLLNDVIEKYAKAIKRVTIVFDSGTSSPDLIAFRKHTKLNFF